MNENLQVILVGAIVLIALNFFITRYLVSITVEQSVDDAMEEKIKRSNKKMMKAMKSTFEKYMTPPDPRMMDPRVMGQIPDPRMAELERQRHGYGHGHTEGSRGHRSSRRDEEDSIDDPAADDQYDEDDSLE